MTSGTTDCIKFYYSWQRPYAQRVWIALNQFGVKYELIESIKLDKEKSRYIKNENLLKSNSKGTIPTIDVNGEVIIESINIIDYLHQYSKTDDVNFLSAELKQDADSFNHTIGMKFFDMIFKDEITEREETWKTFTAELEKFAIDIQEGGYYKSATMNVVDVVVFPIVARLCLMESFREKTLDKGLPWVEKLHGWQERMMSHKAVSDTVEDQKKLTERWRELLVKMGAMV